MSNDDKRDRDHRTPRLPPAVVQAQIAGPVKKLSESYTPTQGVPVISATMTKKMAPGYPTPTNLNVINRDNEPLEVALDRRTRDTKNNTITTLKQIEELRREQDAKHQAQAEQMVAHASAVADLRVALARTETALAHAEKQNERIISMLEKDRELQHRRAATDIDIDAEERRARIQNENLNQNLTRTVKLKAVLTLLSGGGVVALLIELITQKC